jgi:hypothetical protein
MTDRTGLPRWVMVSVIMGLLLAVLVVVVLLMSGGAGHVRPPHG